MDDCNPAEAYSWWFCSLQLGESTSSRTPWIVWWLCIHASFGWRSGCWSMVFQILSAHSMVCFDCLGCSPPGNIGVQWNIIVVLYLVWPAETFKVSFWMRKFGSMSFKRTWIWSISNRIGSLDLGSLTEREKRGTVPTTTRYKDKNGKVRFKGNANLKRSQYFGYLF